MTSYCSILSMEEHRPFCFDNIEGAPNIIPIEVSKCLPKFSIGGSISAGQHMDDLMDIFDELDVEHEDVSMRFIVKSLSQNVR